MHHDIFVTAYYPVRDGRVDPLTIVERAMRMGFGASVSTTVVSAVGERQLTSVISLGSFTNVINVFERVVVAQILQDLPETETLSLVHLGPDPGTLTEYQFISGRMDTSTTELPKELGPSTT